MTLKIKVEDRFLCSLLIPCISNWATFFPLIISGSSKFRVIPFIVNFFPVVMLAQVCPSGIIYAQCRAKTLCSSNKVLPRNHALLRCSSLCRWFSDLISLQLFHYLEVLCLHHHCYWSTRLHAHSIVEFPKFYSKMSYYFTLPALFPLQVLNQEETPLPWVCLASLIWYPLHPFHP